MPFFKMLADNYAMSDNMHQSVQGGTGANHSLLGFGDAVAWTDGMGNPAPPPANLIANPNPRAGTNNRYTVDGNFSNCSDPTQPGVGPIVSYLGSLPYDPKPNCAASTYYYLNNTNPAYKPNGALKTTGTFVPPTTPALDRRLAERQGHLVAVLRRRLLKAPAAAATARSATRSSTRRRSWPIRPSRTEHIKDTVDMYTDIANGTLPAVSFAHPDGALDGHPSSSKIGLFEAYVAEHPDQAHANPALKASTVVIVTFDEGGGYYDSGFIQPVDFFGDGPRIPLIVVSPYTKGGKIDTATPTTSRS